MPRLFTASFALVLAATSLGYAHLALLTPTLPLFIHDHGGTATLVGLASVAFSLPSFALRPLIGRAVDEWNGRAETWLGTLALGLSSFGYLVYHAGLLLVGRTLQGTAWAAYNTGIKVFVSTAPAERHF